MTLVEVEELKFMQIIFITDTKDEGEVSNTEGSNLLVKNIFHQKYKT